MNEDPDFNSKEPKIGWVMGGPDAVKPRSGGTRLLSVMAVMVLWILSSVFLTTVNELSYIASTEGWEKVIMYWVSLMYSNIFLSIVLPLFLCIGLFIILYKSWSK